MTARCNKCGQGDPHGSDSWCLACSAVEHIVGELKASWGTQGSRAIASDLLVSVTRQVRALRRLGIAGAGRGRPSVPEAAGTSRAASARPRREEPPREDKAPHSPPRAAEGTRRDPTPGPEQVKREAPSQDERSAYSESEESEGREDDKEVVPDTSGLKAVPKARAEERSEIPRRRTSERRDRRGEEPAGTHRADRREGGHSRDRRGHHHEHRERHRSRSRHHREEKRRRKPKRRRPGHRGGSCHQKVWRAEKDPFKRFHHQQPDAFWDREPGFD